MATYGDLIIQYQQTASKLKLSTAIQLTRIEGATIIASSHDVLVQEPSQAIHSSWNIFGDA
jgi:hypothetical protein